MSLHAQPLTSEKRSAGTVERHVQTILISIVTGSIIFAANYFYNNNRAQAVLQTQLEVLTVQVLEMRADLKALQQNYAKANELEKLETRVRTLETDKRK